MNKHRWPSWIAGAALLSGGVAIGLALATRWNLPAPIVAEVSAPPRGAPAPPAANAVEMLENAYVEAADRVSPAVVNIATEKTVTQRMSSGDPFLDQFFSFRPYQYKTRSLGSGSIISADGFILTNNHVVADADVVRIFLLNGEEYVAHKIGSDERTDLAVVKIDAKKRLPLAVLGDSDRIRVGQFCLAVGNPFGLQHTVTSGVISARGRSHLAGVGENRYQNFIQTDCSINPGNSGGPLVNLRGEIIGVNTMIYSQSGGSVGIGFAVPVNMAKRVIADLTKTGRVARPSLGISVEELSPEAARERGIESGVAVSRIVSGSSADKAGLQRGDILREVAGMRIARASDLGDAILEKPLGETVTAKILRDGKERTVSVKLTEPPTPSPSNGGLFLGMTVTALTDELRGKFGIRVGEGVVVTAVEAGSAAEAGGVQAGDVVLGVQSVRTRNFDEFLRVVKRLPTDEGVVLAVQRGPDRGNIVLSPGR